MKALANHVSGQRSVGLHHWLAAIVLLGMAGCARNSYYAGSLPAEYRVQPAANIKAVDLTRLSGAGLSNSRIVPGDILELTVATAYANDRPNKALLRVPDEGVINVPLVGPVQVAGLDPAEAEQSIAALAVQRQVYRNPHVTLMIKQRQTNKVTVVGAVKTPGVYELPRGTSDLISALAWAGGMTPEASAEVEVLHKSQLQSPGAMPPRPDAGTVAGSLTSYGQPQHSVARPASTRVNLTQISTDNAGDHRLGDGDVVMVFPQNPRVVHIMGLVRKPAQYEIPSNRDLHVLDALALAGGRSVEVADSIDVIRRVPDQIDPIVIHVSIREAKSNGDANLRLAPGDLVSVEETPLTFAWSTLNRIIRIGIGGNVRVF